MMSTQTTVVPYGRPLPRSLFQEGTATRARAADIQVTIVVTRESFWLHRDSWCIPRMFTRMIGSGGGRGQTSLAAAVPSSSCPRRIDMPSFISVFPFANALENALENVFSILISVHTHSCSSSKLYNGAPPPPSEPLPLSQASNTKSVQPEAGSSCGREQRIGCN